MNETYPGLEAATGLGEQHAIADVDVLPELSAEPTDRSMLVVQYVLATVAAIAAVLLAQAS